MSDEKISKQLFVKILVVSIVISVVFGGVTGGLVASNKVVTDWIKSKIYKQDIDQEKRLESRIAKVEQDSNIISAVQKVSPSVVSIIASKDLPKIEQFNPNDEFFKEFFGQSFDEMFGNNAPQANQNGTEKTEVGSGTGFVISSDGYILTNKHVVAYDDVEYTVLFNDETKYPAKVLARDSVSDIAVLKIEANNLPAVELGESNDLKIGQGVIAIGNALGEFSNTVSTGVISGLGRSVLASDFSGGESNQLIGVIQTDASINFGNSGGPLLNNTGQVIGINTAIAYGAQNIGFAIPVDEVKNAIESVKKFGKIVRPWLGVRYVPINKVIQEENKLSVDYGVLIVKGDRVNDLAVVSGSPADKAGLVENDIILEINGQKLTTKSPLIKILSQFNPGDEVTFKILHQGEEKEIKVKLEERD